jgi:hypothetical protein
MTKTEQGACATCKNARARSQHNVVLYPGKGHGFCSKDGIAFLPRAKPDLTAPFNTCWEAKP